MLLTQSLLISNVFSLLSNIYKVITRQRFHLRKLKSFKIKKFMNKPFFILWTVLALAYLFYPYECLTILRFTVSLFRKLIFIFIEMIKSLTRK